ncbi:MAG: peptide deformylase [Patescibacteria group bacterium]
MAQREIIKVPNQKLNTICEKVNFKTDGEEVKKLVSDLIDTLETAKPKGAGLAAPQIGILKRVCIAKKFSLDPKNPENELDTNFILINPEIITKSEPTSLGWEGCLSIPDTYGQVDRSKRIKIEAFDINGNKFSLKADGFFARVILHEIDHMNGILFTSKIVGKTLTESQLDELFKKEEALNG